MIKARTVRTDLFEAKSQTGRTYEIEELTTQFMTTGLDGSNSRWLDQAIHYHVRSGGSANKLSQTEFHILASGEDATRI